MANSDTLAPTRKPRAAKATAPAPSAWEAQFNKTRDAALALLEAAHGRDETSDTEIYFYLTRGAARLLAAETVDGNPSLADLSSTYWEILALINACQLGCEDLDETALSLVRQAHDTLYYFAMGEPPAQRGGIPSVGQRANAPPAALSLSGQVADATITRDTALPHGGKAALEVVIDCCFDIEPLAEHLIRLADEQHFAVDMNAAPSPAMLRTIGVRVRELNSIVMSYLGEDNVTIGECHRRFYSGAYALPEGSLS